MEKNRCALILSGFLRSISNLDNLNQFIQKNSHCDFDIYINSYDTIGFPTKASATDDYDKCGIVSSEIFNKLSAPVHCQIQNYNNFQKIIGNYIKDTKFVDIASYPNVKQNVKSFNKKYPEKKSSIEWELNKLLSQFHMNWINIMRIDRPYDTIIKSRLDVNHHLLPVVPEILETDSVYGTDHHRWNDIPFIYDHYYMVNYKNTNILRDIFCMDTVYNNYENGSYVNDWKGGISCELNQSLGLFVHNNLKLTKIPCKVGVNRKSK